MKCVVVTVHIPIDAQSTSLEFHTIRCRPTFTGLIFISAGCYVLKTTDPSNVLNLSSRPPETVLVKYGLYLFQHTCGDVLVSVPQYDFLCLHQ